MSKDLNTTTQVPAIVWVLNASFQELIIAVKTFLVFDLFSTL